MAAAHRSGCLRTMGILSGRTRGGAPYDKGYKTGPKTYYNWVFSVHTYVIELQYSLFKKDTVAGPVSDTQYVAAVNLRH